MPTTEHSTICRKNYHVPVYLIDELFLDFCLGEKDCVVTARSDMFLNSVSEAATRELVLYGEELELLEIQIDGVPLNTEQYQKDKNGLTLFDLPEKFVLEVKTRIFPSNIVWGRKPRKRCF